LWFDRLRNNFSANRLPESIHGRQTKRCWAEVATTPIFGPPMGNHLGPNVGMLHGYLDWLAVLHPENRPAYQQPKND
jgi:hypothetical protein